MEVIFPLFFPQFNKVFNNFNNFFNNFQKFKKVFNRVFNNFFKKFSNFFKIFKKFFFLSFQKIFYCAKNFNSISNFFRDQIYNEKNSAVLSCFAYNIFSIAAFNFSNLTFISNLCYTCLYFCGSANNNSFYYTTILLKFQIFAAVIQPITS